MMRTRPVVYMLAACVVGVAVVAATMMTAAVYAQDDAQAAVQPAPPPILAGPPGAAITLRLDGNLARPMMMRMVDQSPPAIAVDEGFVFVVYGGTLFQFTIDGLQEINKVALVPAQPAG